MDPEDNLSLSPPNDERVEWAGFWITEIYPPSHAKSLIDGANRLSSKSHGLFRTEDAGVWVRSARKWSGGFMNIGFFAHPGTFLASNGAAGLPKEFLFAQLEVRQLAPGISVVQAQFAIQGELRASLDTIARTDRATRAEPIRKGGGHSIIGPEHQKEDAIAGKRSELRKLATDWLSRYLPGYFISDDASNIPTWDFLTTEHSSLVAERDDRSRWRQTFGFGWGDKCVADDLPGVELILTRGGERSNAVDSFVTTRSNAEKILAQEAGSGTGMNSFLQLIDRALRDLLPLWTLDHALRSYERRFGDIRDDLSSAPNWFESSGRPRALRRKVLPLAFDLETLYDASRNKRALAMPLRHTSTEFGPPNSPMVPPEKASNTPLLEILRKEINARGESVQAQARSTTSGLKVQTDLLVASSNIRLQWAVILITVVFGGLGIYFATTQDSQEPKPQATFVAPVESTSSTGPTRSPGRERAHHTKRSN